MVIWMDWRGKFGRGTFLRKGMPIFFSSFFSRRVHDEASKDLTVHGGQKKDIGVVKIGAFASRPTRVPFLRIWGRKGRQSSPRDAGFPQGKQSLCAPLAPAEVRTGLFFSRWCIGEAPGARKNTSDREDVQKLYAALISGMYYFAPASGVHAAELILC